MTTPANSSPSRRALALALALLGLVASLSFALAAESAPNFSWAVRAGGPKADKTRGLCTDAVGNIYLTGEFSGRADFGEHVVESKGDLDFFVAKYSPDGRCLWISTGGGTKTDRGYSVAVDAQGNVFTTGHFQSSDAMFGNEALREQRGDYDLFVAKHDAQGRLLWVKTGGGAGYDFGHGIDVDRAGNCYVTGSIVEEITAANGKPARVGRAFVAKFAPDGALAWRCFPTGTGATTGQDLAVDAEGNAVICGVVSGSTLYGELPLANPAGRDAFAAKFDASGRALWVFKADGSTNAMFASVALDGRGGVCLSGMFQGALKLGGKTISSRGAHDVLIAKLSPEGTLRWFHTAGSAQTDYGLGITADAAGNCYVTGELSDGAEFLGHTIRTGERDLYAAKFADDGALRWLRTGGGPKSDLSYCIALGTRGNIFLSGAFAGTATYGRTPALTSKGANDIMLIQLAP
jgi:hypothetical protein